MTKENTNKISSTFILKKEIILVDDEEIYHEIWRDICRSNNVKITCFFHPDDMQRYLNFTKSNNYDALIFDYYFENEELNNIFDIVKFCKLHPNFKNKLFLCSSILCKTGFESFFKKIIRKDLNKILLFIKNL